MLPRLLDAITGAFSVARPSRFLRDPDHCDECRDHEQTLSRVTPATISLMEVGHPSWDPLCFVTDEAFDYLMPGLARLATGQGECYYLGQWLLHLERQADHFSSPQKSAVLLFLEYLYFDLMPSEIDGHDDADALGRVFEKLTVRSLLKVSTSV